MEWLPTNPPPHALRPKRAEEVRLFTTARPVRPFVEIGLITVERGGVDADPLDMLRRVWLEGAAHGCDGVVVDDQEKSATPEMGVVLERTTGLRAACIVFE